MSQSVRPPRYFHLLWDEDLEDLREILECIRDRRSEVVSHWYELYFLHFGDDRTLSQAEFSQIFEAALLTNQEALLRKDMDGYAASVLRTGRRLAERHVPLDELIAAIQLFEEAAQTVFPQAPPPSTSIYTKFDKLSHIRIILLVGAYARLQSAAAASRIHALEIEARNLPAQERTRFHGLVGASAAMRELYGRIEAAGRDDGPVLIVGERGSGKELTARAVHECGPHRVGPFVALRCAALPSYLVESELFGYQRDVLNGNHDVYLGLYRVAEGGTLFLDELTEIPLHAQVKLLHAVEAVDRGGAELKVRIVAATSRDPDEAARVGQLDPGLRHRFRNVLRMPPLREHSADITLLVGHFIDLLNERLARRTRVIGVEDAALEAMARYGWPGNVQELCNALETAFGCERSALIGLADLPTAISGRSDKTRPLPTISFETFADAERGVLKRALELTGGNKVRAAKLLKISRKKLYSGIAKYGLGSAANLRPAPAGPSVT
jgi:two-component system response regulator AtoC